MNKDVTRMGAEYGELLLEDIVAQSEMLADSVLEGMAERVSGFGSPSTSYLAWLQEYPISIGASHVAMIESMLKSLGASKQDIKDARGVAAASFLVRLGQLLAVRSGRIA